MNIRKLFKLSSRSDLINYGLPFLFLGLIFLEVLHGLSLTTPQYIFTKWISAILLFNGLHVAMTFINIAFIPEYKQILKIQKHSIVVGLLLIILIIFLFTTSVANSIYPIDSPIAYGMIFLIALMPSLHTIRQSMGLSLQINSSHISNLPDTQKVQFKKNELVSRKYEKLAIFFLIIGSFSLGQAFITSKLNFPIQKNSIKLLTMTLTTIGFLLLVWSFIKLKNKKIFIKKCLFSARYIVYVVGPFTIMGTFGSKAIHGVEYMLLQEKIFFNSQISKKKYFSYGLVVTCALFLFLLSMFPNAPFGIRLFNLSETTTKYLILCNAVLTYYHYYLDSILFQLKKTDVRQIMAPLLKDVI